VRISSDYIGQMFVASQDQEQTQIAQTQQQISSGLQFSNPAQDPVAATQVMGLQSTLAQTAQYGTTANLAQARLNTESSTLSTVISTLQSVRTLALEGANATTDATTRSTLATQIQGDAASILQLANTQDGTGQYLFSGTATTTTPFSQTGNTVTYAGTQGQRLVQIGADTQVADGDSGAAVFLQIPNGNGTFVAAASGANTGTVTVGSNSITNSASWNAGNPPYTIAFSNTLVTSPASTNTGSATVGASSVTNPATFAAGAPPFTIAFSAPGVYTVTNSAGTQVGSGNNFTPGGTISFAGAQLTLAGTPAGGDSFTVSGSTDVPAAYTVTDSTGATVGSGSYTDGGSIAFNGAQLTLSGTPNAGDSISVSTSTHQSVFTTLQNLVTALNTPTSGNQAGVVNSINLAIQALDQAQNSISNVQAQVGTRLQAIDSQTSTNSSLTLQLQSSVSSLQDLDYAQAATTLNQQMTALQAAQESFAKIEGLSLFNYIQ